MITVHPVAGLKEEIKGKPQAPKYRTIQIHLDQESELHKSRNWVFQDTFSERDSGTYNLDYLHMKLTRSSWEF